MRIVNLAAGALAVAIVASGFAGAAQAATNLIANGDFSTPNQGGGWSEPTGTGWYSRNDAVEIGYSPIYGLQCASNTCQNLEVNANTWGDDYQVVSGLTVGHKYDLSWLYGGRTAGGPDSLNVYFGGQLLTTDSGSVGQWTANNFVVTATSTSETLEFVSTPTSGNPGYGNEITNVSLSAVPEPATWAMLILGMAMIGFAARRRSGAMALQA